MSKFKSKSKYNLVNLGSGLCILGITVVTSLFPSQAGLFFKSIQNWLVDKTSWFYVLSVAIILFFSLWLMFSRMGDIKLGPDDSTPEFGNISWFCMLFSAGMGIGLIFFGVAEPLMHYASPPTGDAFTSKTAQEAMKITFFHWGLHAWAIYALLAVCLAYFAYRKNLPLLPRSIFYPLIKERIYGRVGDLIDMFCIISTMFGVATSLGFGVTQVNAGLNYLFGIPQNINVQIILITVITMFATISVLTGLDNGIKKLSNINILLAFFLLFIIFIYGDFIGIMKVYVQNTGTYLSDIIYKTFNLYAYERKGSSWIGGWTQLYWGWWFSFAPFVGMFIARISKGRTIREFMCGVLFAPTAFTFLWMTVFGNQAITIASKDPSKALLETVNNNIPLAIFKFFEYFEYSTFLSSLGVILLVTFFVSSSDSGSLIINTLASGDSGKKNFKQKIFWSSLEGAVAISLLMSGGLDSLQTMTIASAFPIIFILLIGAMAFFKSLKADYLLLNSVQNHNTTVQYSQASTPWKKRLDTLIQHPQAKEAARFLSNKALPALNELSEELNKKGVESKVILSDDSIKITVENNGVEDFVYGICLRPFVTPTYATQNQDSYFRAEVFLIRGGQNYDVFGYSKELIIADAVTQYEKYLHFLHTNNSVEEVTQ